MYYLRLKDQTENKGRGLFFSLNCHLQGFVLIDNYVCLSSFNYDFVPVQSCFPIFLILIWSFFERDEFSTWVLEAEINEFDTIILQNHSSFHDEIKSILRSRKIGKFFHLKQNHEPQQDQGTQQRNHKEQNTGVEWNAWWFKKRCNNTRKS